MSNDQEPIVPMEVGVLVGYLGLVVAGIYLAMSRFHGWNYWAGHIDALGLGLALLAAGLVSILVARPWLRRWAAVVPLACLLPLIVVTGWVATGAVVALGWFPGSDRWPLERPMLMELTSHNNLRQIGYGLVTRGSLPSGCLVDERGEPIHGWPVQMLPYFEQENLYRLVDRQRPWDDPVNKRAFQTRINVLEHPAPQGLERDVAGYALNYYATNPHVIGGDRARKLSDFDAVGTANVLLLGEAHGAYKAWGHPIQWRDPDLGLNASPHGFGTPFGRGRTQFVMLDGSVRSFAVGRDDAAFRTLAQGSRR